MIYPLSQTLLGKVSDIKTILINAHRSPDADCVGSALSLKMVLESMGKTVTIICPDEIPHDLKFLPHSESVLATKFSQFPFSDYELFIIVDTAYWDIMAESIEFKEPPIETFVIDNHVSNPGYGKTNLIDFETSSVCEMLFNIYSDWNVSISKDIATCLYSGILGDTGLFQFEIHKNTFKVADELIKLGADRKQIILKLFNSQTFTLLKLWGEILLVLTLEKEHRFLWAAITAETVEKYGFETGLAGSASTLFARIVENTDFGLIMVEWPKGRLNLSFRSRTDFDVSQIAVKFGGGGHKAAAGATLEDIEYEQAVNRVIETTKGYAKKN